MENYVEEYDYNSCFWMKPNVLYTHAKSKFDEYQSVGKIFKSLSDSINKLCQTLLNLSSFYIEVDVGSTLNKGILTLFQVLAQMANSLKKLYNDIISISNNIEDKNVAFNSKKEILNMCDGLHKTYYANREQLKKQEDLYYDSMNKAIESFLLANSKNHTKNKKDNELKSKIDFVKKQREEYKKQIDIVEKSRTDYMDIQGNIFAAEEEFERDCTNELKQYLFQFIDIIKNFKIKIELNDNEVKNINEIDGNKDNKNFAKNNRSLLNKPERYLFKEYVLNINYYKENFNFIKNKLKNKTPTEITEFQHKLTKDIKIFIAEITKEEPDKIHNNILKIAKKLKENNLNQNDFNYLISKFEERYEKFCKWKEEIVGDQNYRKVGAEWEDRFCYMYTFLKYLNKTRGENKELNEINYNFLGEAMKKILELNNNEDIDYVLCGLVIILSLSFYMTDSNYHNNKKYLNEIIKTSPIMQKQGFWVSLAKFKLKEDNPIDNKSEKNIQIDNLSDSTVITNNVVYQLTSFLYNVMQFISDSDLINKIIYDIFKYCNIPENSREVILQMIEGQIESEDIKGVVLNKELLLNEK